ELSNQPDEIALRHGRDGQEDEAAQGVVGVVGHDVTDFQAVVHHVFFIEADAGYWTNPKFLRSLLHIAGKAGFKAAGGDVQQFTGQVAFAVVHLYFQINIVRRRNVDAVSGAALQVQHLLGKFGAVLFLGGLIHQAAAHAELNPDALGVALYGKTTTGADQVIALRGNDFIHKK